MGLINWIFDFYQHSKIADLREEIERTRFEAAHIRGGAAGSIDADRLERAIGELALAVKTLQLVAVEKGLCSQQELRQRMQQIDAEDGRADNRTSL